MKAVINGFRYDTEKAEKVLDYSSGYAGDFQSQEFSLYRTPRGFWFIAGSGGPMTRFARPIEQNSWRGGSKIIPLAPSALLDLLENIQDDVDCESVFDYPEVKEKIKEA